MYVCIPLQPISNRGRFSNISGLLSSGYLTCVKWNWPISNLHSESEHKYSNCTRTIAGSPVSRPPPSYSKANLEITHTESLFAGCLDYCNSLLYGLPAYQIQKLQRVQNSAVRLVSEESKFFHITPLLRALHWLPVAYWIVFKFHC